MTVGTEAEYLANYIGLEKLRLRDTTRVEFLADLPHPHRPLAPLLLPLVENCFRHAIDPDGPTLIRIRLTQTDTSLTLQTHNSVPPHLRSAPSGLGLPNLRARLAQFYPGARHRFRTDATATHGYRAFTDRYNFLLWFGTCAGVGVAGLAILLEKAACQGR